MYRKLYSAQIRFSNGFLLLFALIFIAGYSFSQPTNVWGKVTDKETGKPIPYVSVVFKNTQIGVLTDTLGGFNLTSKEHVDSIRLSTIGYLNKTIGVISGKSTELQIELKPDLVKLSEITILPDDGPVRRILKEMTDRKKQNNPDKYPRYSYRKYTKWEYHLNNVGEKLIQSGIFRKDQSVFKTNSDGSRYLPIYFSEQLVFNEFQRNPAKQKSTVLADKTSGVGVLQDYEISGYTSALDMEVNFYDNYINLFLQNFVSPLADNGWFYYKYYLADSTIVNGRKQYRIEFFPRRLGDKVFKGYLTTETKNYSLLEIDGTLATTSYLNFLKSMRLKSNYQMVHDSIPFYRRNQIDAVFDYVPGKNNPSKKPINLFFTQSAVIDSVTVNQPDEVKLITGNGHYETLKLPGATQRDENYWNKHRMEELNQRELEISAAIDSVSQVPAVKVADKMTRMKMTSYLDLGKLEFGPYTNTINTNKVEGIHLFAGFRTSSEISTRYMFWGGLGYGFLNKKINGIAGFGYKFPANYRKVVKIAYDDKIVRAGESEKLLFLYENALSPTENNIISQIFKRDELDELFREQKLASSFEYEWYPGLMNKISANYIRHFSPQFYPFLRNGSPVNSVSAVDFSVDTRFSWKEKVIDDKFLRVYMATDYPIIHVLLGGGQVFYSGKQNYYGKIFGTIEQYFMIGQTGFNYAVEGGMYFGKLPYTMLDIPRGNETYGLYTYDFNMLNYMEYVHDKYLHAYLEYHLNGFLFNRLPLLKKTGLREVFSFKTIVGSLSDKNQQIVEFPVTISKMDNPYIEFGAGVENIFKMFRLESVWRVNPKSTVGAPSFGLRVKIKVQL
ncbi:MAG: carboxypeptidase-like regulatory domain-containing protein [Prolixibacteraceae bacterium]|nr:carboxypeptidase-like regulatory domain-containing protein [Prolixibacteraceae bacterium]